MICNICDEKCYDKEALVFHCNSAHLFCKFCHSPEKLEKAQNIDFYELDSDLKIHYIQEHLLCEEPNCPNPLFDDMEKYTKHMTEIHGKSVAATFSHTQHEEFKGKIFKIENYPERPPSHINFYLENIKLPEKYGDLKSEFDKQFPKIKEIIKPTEEKNNVKSEITKAQKAQKKKQEYYDKNYPSLDALNKSNKKQSKK